MSYGAREKIVSVEVKVVNSMECFCKLIHQAWGASAMGQLSAWYWGYQKPGTALPQGA